MKKEELCRGKLSKYGGLCDVRGEGNVNHHGVLNTKRIRMKCPDCGRRIFSSLYNDMDGTEFWHDLPPHKPKEWWKKGKRARNTPEKQVKRF